ncbi:uncharacterized protein MYCFIDRAFT_173310 [Pseudocercospora fijiensis CIRAD86]|uniref:Uncharacterized protein n=1 Tax=Pseudocercospora fijiensis (strain CIRAD86) TaxID=383855 RepID=M3AI87_PSEFD|nr:uncharacterized protein MYCFIDRAFT_173310 [Pseudocercospora fijiensis CIRAD86]EME84291.1 hypothetical protein MYCFIDRAFT_173310 [Pseudocercospora fijiensis CIRAD86]
MATSSSWNSSGFYFSANTNTMDRESMPSEKAEAARLRSAEVMAALKSGEPGAADRMMGGQKESGSKGIVPLQWVKSKFGGKKKKMEVEKEVQAGKVGADDQSVMTRRLRRFEVGMMDGWNGWC